MKHRWWISFVFALLAVVGCSPAEAPVIAFEEFTLGMSIRDVDAELDNQKWRKVGTFKYANTVRYDLQLLEPRPVHLDNISRVHLAIVDEALVCIEVLSSAETFSKLKEAMKSVEGGLTLRYGDPGRRISIEDLQRSQVSGPEPVTLAVWQVDPLRVVAIAIHSEGGQPIGFVQYAYLDKVLTNKTP